MALNDLVRDFATKADLAVAKIEALLKFNYELFRSNHELVQRYS